MSSAWFPYYRHRPDAGLRLICFPFAGGGAGYYQGWEAFLPSGMEVCAVQLPGREGRFREPLCRNLNLLLDEVQRELRAFPEMRSALIGYSVGAIFAYALGRRLVAGGAPPVHLVPIACPSPPFLDDRALKSSMSDAEFEARVIELNDGSPEPVNRELLSVMIPAIRSDIETVESFDPTERTPLSCPVSVLGGDADPSVERAHLEDWRSFTTSEFRLRYFPGNHFFLRECLPEAARWLGERLLSGVTGASSG